MKHVKHFYIIVFLLAFQTANADIRLFNYQSLKQIETSYHNEKFLISFWSIDCPACFKELSLFKQLEKQHKDMNLVLVNTDGPGQINEVNNIIKEYSLQGSEHWIFSDSNTLRLRYNIDDQWAGELPRTYFYDRTHNRVAVSGLISRQSIVNWLQAN